nr:MAG TPA: hypothetical protein [Bacteriophage sp.]
MITAWTHYQSLSKPVPIVLCSFCGHEFVMYDWDDWDDFYKDLSKHIIKLNNYNSSVFQQYSPRPLRLIYKRNDLLYTLRNIARFVFFKGHRVYTNYELSLIQRYYTELSGKHLELASRFFRTEAMEVKFDDLIHYVR